MTDNLNSDQIALIILIQEYLRINLGDFNCLEIKPKETGEYIQKTKVLIFNKEWKKAINLLFSLLLTYQENNFFCENTVIMICDCLKFIGKDNLSQLILRQLMTIENPLPLPN